MIAALKGFAMFWYRFFVGDDWTIAAGVVLALGVTYWFSRLSLPAWWILPAAALTLLAGSVRRADRPK
jgi:hypothetical protein